MGAHYNLYYIRSMKHNKSAFTLLEIAISISIIAFIIGGVMTGKSIVQSSRIRGLIKEIDTIKSALMQFNSIYGYYPGDFPGASNLWCSSACPGVSGNAANCVPGGADGTTIGYCNGSGNGKWDCPDGFNNDERVRAWQHLALAGLYPGSYTGINGGGFQWTNDPTNTPLSKAYTGAGFSFYQVSLYGSAHFSMSIGAYTPPYVPTLGPMRGDIYATPLFTPLFGYLIDKKIDDGIPNTGSFGIPNTGSFGVPSTSTFLLQLNGNVADNKCVRSDVSPNIYNTLSSTAALCDFWYVFD